MPFNKEYLIFLIKNLYLLKGHTAPKLLKELQVTAGPSEAFESC